MCSCLHTEEVNSSDTAAAVKLKPRQLLTQGCIVMQKADLWSCGVILFALLYGRYPFDASEKYYMRKIVSADYTLPEQVPVSAECVALMQRLLVPEPRQRMCMQEILIQPWFCCDLPSGAQNMNQFYLQHSAPLDEVLTICRRARSVLSSFANL